MTIPNVKAILTFLKHIVVLTVYGASDNLETVGIDAYMGSKCKELICFNPMPYFGYGWHGWQIAMSPS